MSNLRSLTLVMCLAVATPSWAAETIFPPGSRIGLQPPAQMSLSRGLSGFRDPATGAAIVTIEMPAEAYPSMAAGFTEDALKSQGFALSLRETPKVDGSDAILISGVQTDGNVKVPKTILLASEPTMTALVIAQLPSVASPSAVADAVKALRTVAFRPPLAMAEQLAALPFRLGDLAGFRPVRAMGGTSLLMTDGPNDVVKEAEQPIMIVAQSFAPAPPPDQRETFARTALVANTFVKDAMLERSQGYRQAGADWHEIVARAKDGHSGNPVVVVQTIRFEPDGYTRMVGVVRADKRDLVLPRFRRVVDSIAITP